MPNTWWLNFFLLDPNVRSEAGALETTNGLHHHAINDGMGFTGTLWYRFGKEHPPDWSRFVNPNLKRQVRFPESKSTAAVLFVRTRMGFYAYTFGIGGRSLLKQDVYVPDFGKKTVLSIADPDRLRSIDLRAVRDQPFLIRQQPSRGTRLRAFGVDTLQDHLRAITGIPHGPYERLAKQVTGADTLAYRATLDFSDLGVKSDEFLAAFNSNAYQQVRDFTWVDQIALVRAQAKLKILDEALLDRVNQGTFGVSPPEMIEWHRGPTFAFVSKRICSLQHDFLSPEAFLEALRSGNPNTVMIDQLKQHRVYCFYNGSSEPEFKWSMYECIELDLVYQGEEYAFAAGRWSHIAARFQRDVNEFVEELKNGAPTLPAAMFQQDHNRDRTHVDEGRYITRVTDLNPNTMAKVHQCGRQIYVDGVEVELCDIYDSSKDFIHLKIWRGSQGFSALAMQASNAAELLLRDRQFVVDSRALLEAMGRQYVGVLPDRFNPREYRIVIGLIRREAGEIPFFSRLTLMRAAERIESRGLRTAFVIIPVQ